MTRTWREFGSVLVRRGQQVLPVPVSIGLIAFLVWRVRTEELLKAFRQETWPWLVAATVVQLVVLFLWDSVCVWWLFSQPDRQLSFRSALRIRCDTVIWSAINLEIGQAAFAWKISQTLGVSLPNTMSYCAILGLFDAASVLSLALIGSFIYPLPVTTHYLRWICVAGLMGLVLLALSVKFLPERYRHRIRTRTWASWIDWLSWRVAWRLWGLRLIMFALVMIYAGVGLAICQVPVDPAKVLGVIPFVFLAESLPGTGGLGEREFALVYLYPGGEEHRAVLLSFGLIWSTVVIVGRVLISLVSWNLPRGHAAMGGAEEPQSVASTDPSPRAVEPV